MAAERLQVVLAGARCGLAGSGRQAGPGLPSSPRCEEQAQQGSLLGADLRCGSDVLGDLVCTWVHLLGEGDDKIQQDRGFPKQNPAGGWVEV